MNYPTAHGTARLELEEVERYKKFTTNWVVIGIFFAFFGVIAIFLAPKDSWIFRTGLGTIIGYLLFSGGVFSRFSGIAFNDMKRVCAAQDQLSSIVTQEMVDAELRILASNMYVPSQEQLRLQKEMRSTSYEKTRKHIEVDHQFATDDFKKASDRFHSACANFYAAGFAVRTDDWGKYSFKSYLTEEQLSAA
jgi:hypothetical protein